MVTVTMTVCQTTPQCRVTFSDGVEIVYPTVAQMVAYAQGAENDDLVRRMCIAYLAARSPGLTNAATVLNKDFIFDLSAPQPIKVQ